MNHTDQYNRNQQALNNPAIGDYWQEMFCLYFVVVDVTNDDITVLSCLGGPNSYLRKNEINAKIEIDRNHWGFDYSKSMVVNRDWIKRTVKYESIDGFVADVSNTEKTRAISREWRDHRQQQIRDQIKQLNKELEEVIAWDLMKQ